jgi:hypothetical protein
MQHLRRLLIKISSWIDLGTFFLGMINIHFF